MILKRIIAKYAGKCGKCDAVISAGTECYYNRTLHKLYHVGCVDAAKQGGLPATVAVYTRTELADMLLAGGNLPAAGTYTMAESEGEKAHMLESATKAQDSEGEKARMPESETKAQDEETEKQLEKYRERLEKAQREREAERLREEAERAEEERKEAEFSRAYTLESVPLAVVRGLTGRTLYTAHVIGAARSQAGTLVYLELEGAAAALKGIFAHIVSRRSGDEMGKRYSGVRLEGCGGVDGGIMVLLQCRYIATWATTTAGRSRVVIVEEGADMLHRTYLVGGTLERPAAGWGDVLAHFIEVPYKTEWEGQLWRMGMEAGHVRVLPGWGVAAHYVEHDAGKWNHTIETRITELIGGERI